MMRSRFFRGHVWHQRFEPRPHAFRHALQLACLDLDELPALFRGRWLWSVERRNWVSFRRADYLGSPGTPLREAVLERVESELGRRPRGRVELLTQLRSLGYLFNPVSFYFCHGAGDELDAIVAEITNTPWGERHAYVLDAAASAPDSRGAHVFSFAKGFHVSPFFDMDQVYEWRFTRTPERIEVRMSNFEGDREVFQVGLACKAHAMTSRSLAAAAWSYPLQPLRLHAAIYWQAARLYMKRTPFFVHPDKCVPTKGASSA